MAPVAAEPQIDAWSPTRWSTCSLQTRPRKLFGRAVGIGGGVRPGAGDPILAGVDVGKRRPGGVTNTGAGTTAGDGRVATGERVGDGVGGVESASGVGEPAGDGEAAAPAAGDAVAPGAGLDPAGMREGVWTAAVDS